MIHPTQTQYCLGAAINANTATRTVVCGISVITLHLYTEREGGREGHLEERGSIKVGVDGRDEGRQTLTPPSSVRRQYGTRGA